MYLSLRVKRLSEPLKTIIHLSDTKDDFYLIGRGSCDVYNLKSASDIAEIKSQMSDYEILNVQISNPKKPANFLL
jgi:hypothetical protein